MANPVFPTLTLSRGGFDSQAYAIELEDVALKTELEGGYVSSRARHTRTPRKTFTVAYKGITQADRDTLEAFYGTVHGGSVIFDWTAPMTGTVWQVRFTDKLGFTYTGVGVSARWDVTFQVQQA